MNLLSLSLLAAAPVTVLPLAHAQSEVLTEFSSAGAPNAVTRHSIDRVYVNELRADEIQVRGRSYKASFQPGVITVAPFLGSDAPRTETLRFQLASVSVGGVAQPMDLAPMPQLDGKDVVYLRGPVEERYRMRLMETEQTFVFDEPVSGAIEIGVGFESTLERHDTGDGWVFTGGDRGMRMSRAFAVDAAGVTVPLETEFVGDSYTIRMTAGMVAQAEFPLTIDPILTTFGVDDFDIMLTEPRVAYDKDSDSFYIVGTDSAPPVVPPQSQGRICIGGGIGRYQAQAQSSGSSGTINLNVDTTAIPLNPFRPAVAGETLFFQAWYRDANPQPTSSFSNVYYVTFR